MENHADEIKIVHLVDKTQTTASPQTLRNIPNPAEGIFVSPKYDFIFFGCPQKLAIIEQTIGGKKGKHFYATYFNNKWIVKWTEMVI